MVDATNLLPANTLPVAMDEFDDMPGYLIRRAQQISTALFAQETAGFDLTSVQYAAMSAIARNPGVDATRLSALISFDRSTIGDVLERMEAKGWILRTPAPADRRVKQISLSARGERLLAEVHPAVRRVQARLLSPFTAAERRLVLDMLSRLGDLYQEAELPGSLRA